MSIKLHIRGSELRRIVKGAILGLCFLAAPIISSAEIIWSGDFNNRDFSNYHASQDPSQQFFFLVPEYGRPPLYHPGQQHVGNGELLDLVSSPTRGGNFAAKFTVKNSVDGAEAADCDPALDCKTRRTGIQMTTTMRDFYNGIPYNAERWLSLSVFLPGSFDVSGTGWNPIVWGSKGSLGVGSGWLGINIGDNGWSIPHRYHSEDSFNAGINPDNVWWTTVDYTSTYPSKDSWPQGLVDFPDEAASKAALADLNLGGWTDFVFHFRTDVGDSVYTDFEAENTGFLDLYMRAGSGPWVHVLALRPLANVNRGESPDRYYNRGIGQYGPGGYSTAIELYGPKERFWNQPINTTIYVDNHKVGDERTTFEMMSHDGSTPDNLGNLASRPEPPQLRIIE